MIEYNESKKRVFNNDGTITLEILKQYKFKLSDFVIDELLRHVMIVHVGLWQIMIIFHVGEESRLIRHADLQIVNFKQLTRY